MLDVPLFARLAHEDVVLALARFNIISYSTWLQIWHVDGLAAATATNVQRARAFLNNLRADGGELLRFTLGVSWERPWT